MLFFSQRASRLTFSWGRLRSLYMVANLLVLLLVYPASSGSNGDTTSHDNAGVAQSEILSDADIDAWEGDDDLTSDPHQEISLIFCGNRERMWDRVWRIKSNLSSSLARMPRTCHLVTNIRVSDVSNSTLKATANFRTETFKHEEKDSTAFFGRYLYDLKRTGDQLTIQNKKIIVYNDIIPRQMDIFNI